MAAAAEQIFGGAIAQEPAVHQRTARIRTIVVDDSATFLQVACALVELEPAVDLVARADKGGEAIEMVMKLKPDLLLLDVHMPYLDGLTLAWFFRQRFPLVQVVLMSTENTPELRAAGAGCGALDLIDKAHFREEFSAVLHRMQTAPGCR